MTVSEAYQRHYKSESEVLKAWTDGKDFRVRDIFSGRPGCYINISDALLCGVKSVTVRYDHDRKVTIIKVV